MEAFGIIGGTVWLIVALVALQLADKTGSLWPGIIILGLSTLILAAIVYRDFAWLADGIQIALPH